MNFKTITILQSIRTTFLTRKSKEPRPDDHKGAEDVLDDFELEALHNEGNTPIVKNMDLNKPHAEEEVTDEGKIYMHIFFSIFSYSVMNFLVFVKRYD